MARGPHGRGSDRWRRRGRGRRRPGRKKERQHPPDVRDRPGAVVAPQRGKRKHHEHHERQAQPQREPLIDRRPRALSGGHCRQQEADDRREPHERPDDREHSQRERRLRRVHARRDDQGPVQEAGEKHEDRDVERDGNRGLSRGGAMRPGHQRDQRQRRPAQLQDDVPFEPRQRHRAEQLVGRPAEPGRGTRAPPMRRWRPRTRPDARRHAPRRRTSTTSGASGGSSRPILPTTSRADSRSASAATSAAYTPAYTSPAIAQFMLPYPPYLPRPPLPAPPALITPPCRFGRAAAGR